jgi:DNA-binding XRE family transcriptional regulator
MIRSAGAGGSVFADGSSVALLQDFEDQVGEVRALSVPPATGYTNSTYSIIIHGILHSIRATEGTMPDESIGQRIRRLRDAAYLSQSELALKAGISRAVLSRLENDQAVPIQRTVRRLAEVLGIDPHEIAQPSELRARRGEVAAA